jgi:hypothetical protein
MGDMVRIYHNISSLLRCLIKLNRECIPEKTCKIGNGVLKSHISFEILCNFSYDEPIIR